MLHSLTELCGLLGHSKLLACFKMNWSSHLLVLKMTVLILALRVRGQCSQLNVLSWETFVGKGDTVHHEWSHYFTMDNIVHVGGQEMQNSSSWYCLFVPSLSNHGNRRSYSEKLNSGCTGIAM